MENHDTNLPNISAAIGKLSGEIVKITQADSLLDLQIKKALRLEEIRRLNFAESPRNKLVLSSQLASLYPSNDFTQVERLEKTSLKHLDINELGGIAEKIKNAILIFNNNDVTSRNFAALLELKRRAPTTIFCCWDWDSHHWVEHSCMLAAISDFYYAASYENFYLISRFNADCSSVAHCGTIQWSKEYLLTMMPEALRRDRKIGPLGEHIYYAAFNHRNRIVRTLEQQYPEVKFSSHEYHERDEADKFKLWSTYKLHFIAPVLNGLPIRVFDALITGGIPIVPASLRPEINALGIAEHINYYDTLDVIDFSKKVFEANNQFEKQGECGIARRILLALEHHAANRIAKIYNDVKDKLTENAR
jgi:hypothetical protein